MRLPLLIALALGLLTSLAVAGRAQAQAQAGVAPLVAPDQWARYRSRFIFPDGRLSDNGNGGVSHSEGQGFAMLLAAFAGDETTFRRLWGWTRRELAVRPDGLFAWRWRPGDDPHVADTNNATDGDLLIAWALAEGAKRWHDAALAESARDLARAILRQATADTPAGPVLMPGVAGFGAGDMADGPVVNLSYWVFPALDVLAGVAPDPAWARLRATGLALVARARFGPRHLPADWISVAGHAPQPARAFPARFGYDGLRLPLYLAWGGAPTALIEPFDALFQAAGGAPAVVDVATGRITEPIPDPDYRALAALTRCLAGGPRPADSAVRLDTYYAATLNLLVRVAIRQKAPQCG